METIMNNKKIKVVDMTKGEEYPSIRILVDDEVYVVFEYDKDKESFVLRGYSDNDSEEPVVLQNIIVDRTNYYKD